MRLLLSLLLILPLNCFATEEGSPIIKNYESHDYQGGSRIYSIVSTLNGLLYAGDKSGVLVFDGENWYKINTGFPVNSMAVDSNNVVYLLGPQGIGYLKSDSSNTLKYESLNYLVSSEESVKSSRLSKVFSVDNDIVFVLGHEILINSQDRVRIIESPYQFTYFQKVDGVLYLYAEQNGLFVLKDNKIELVSNNTEILRKNVVGLFTAEKAMFLVSSQYGIIPVDSKYKTEKSNELSHIVQTNNVSGTRQIDDSTYVLKTYYEGLFLFHTNWEIEKRYNYDNGLINNTVLTSYEDHWGNLWVGTAKGISSIRLDFPFTIYNSREGLGTGYASIMHKKDIYLATSQGLYKRFIDDKGSIHFVKLFDDPVWSLHEVEQKLYFGNAKGIYVYDNGKVDMIIRIPGGWALQKIPNSKNLYLTSTPIGLLLCQMSSSNTLKAKYFVKGFDKKIRNFEFDSMGYVWAEFDKGVCRLKLSEDFSSAINVRNFDRIEFGNQLKKVRKIEDEIYFIADKGVYRYHKDLEFIREPLFDPFIARNSMISNIIYDKYKKVWLFANEELFRFEIKNDKLVRVQPSGFDFANKSYPLDFENIYYLNENLVLFGQEQGFLCCNLPFSKGSAYSAVIIRRIQTKTNSGKLFDVWGTENFIGFQQKLVLKNELAFSNNSVKFFFSAGSSNNSNIKYATYLFGYDKLWSDWSNENIKEYTNLPPGKYNFVVRSVNKSYEFSYVSSCRFIINPPWYLNLTAKIFYGVFIILFIFLVERLIRIRAKRVQQKLQQKQEDALYRKSQEQIQESLKKEKEIVKLRNDKLRVDNLYKSKELANSTMNIINKNQFLIDLKAELVYIQDLSEKNKEVTDDVRKLIRKVNRDLENEENWKVFEDYFDSVHENFFSKMKKHFPILTTKDLRLCAYLRMNLSTKEIAPLMNITVRGVEIGRYRLRKKLGIDRTASLNDFLFKV